MHSSISTSADLNAGGYDNLLDGVDVVLGRTQRTAPSDELIFSVLATLETLGLTVLGQVRAAVGPDALAAFDGAFDTVAQQDRQHLALLEEFSGSPVTTRFWLPEGVVADPAQALAALAGVKGITTSAYVLGVRLAAKRRNARLARLLAAVASAEAGHRNAALIAAGALQDEGAAQIVGAALAEQPAEYKTANTALVHVQRLGIGFDRRTAGAGTFVDFDAGR